MSLPQFPSSSLAACREDHLDILLIEDNPADARAVELLLSQGLTSPFTLTIVARLADGLARIEAQVPRVILLDLLLPDSQGLATFERLRRQAGDVPVIVFSSLELEQTALAAVCHGAQDYIIKGTCDANTLARSVRFAIERFARLRVEQEIEAADAVQRRLYPQAGPKLPGFEIAGAVFPAQHMCGDYFDFIPLPDGAVLLVVGDVSGHGLRPALIMIETRAYLRALATRIANLGHLLTELNRLLQEIPLGNFVSLFVARLDPAERTLTFACAGHKAFLLRAAGATEELRSPGVVLGVQQDATYTVSPKYSLLSGDLLLIPTDGVHETHSAVGEFFGEPKLLDLARSWRGSPARDIISALHQAAREFAQGAPQADDMAAIVVKTES